MDIVGFVHVLGKCKQTLCSKDNNFFHFCSTTKGRHSYNTRLAAKFTSLFSLIRTNYDKFHIGFVDPRVFFTFSFMDSA